MNMENENLEEENVVCNVTWEKALTRHLQGGGRLVPEIPQEPEKVKTCPGDTLMAEIPSLVCDAATGRALEDIILKGKVFYRDYGKAAHRELFEGDYSYPQIKYVYVHVNDKDVRTREDMERAVHAKMREDYSQTLQERDRVLEAVGKIYMEILIEESEKSKKDRDMEARKQAWFKCLVLAENNVTIAENFFLNTYTQRELDEAKDNGN